MIHISTRLGEESGAVRGIVYVDGDYTRLTREHIENYEETASQLAMVSDAVITNCFGLEWTSMRDALGVKPKNISENKFRKTVKGLLERSILETNGQAPQSPQLAYRQAETTEVQQQAASFLPDDMEDDDNGEQNNSSGVLSGEENGINDNTRAG